MTDSKTSELPARVVHPYPRSARWGAESLLLSSTIQIQFSPQISPDMCAWMLDLWRRYTLGRIAAEVSEAPLVGGPDWSWRIGEGGLPSVTAGDTYALQVGAGGIAARGIHEAGAKDAWKTFLQLLWLRDFDPPCFALPHATIHDGPDMPFRGIHLCVFPETDLPLLEKVIQLAGLLKYSHVVLEFWGMLKLDALPELSWPQAYSKSRATELVQLAKSWGMEVVPMFNMWGHAAASRVRWGRHVVLDQNPSLAPLFEPDGWAWCLSHPRTGPLLRQIASELSELAGPGGYFHIGCDECHSHATCDRCRGRDRIGLLADHVNAMTEHVATLGRRPIMWGDALLENGKWPGVEATGTVQTPTHRAIDKLDRRIVIADWHYDLMEGDVPSLGYFKSKGFDVLAAPWHELKNIRTMARAARRYEAMGMLTTTWHRLPQHMAMLTAAANSGWSAQPGAMEGAHGHWDSMNAWLASHLRRLAPASGDYSISGWHPFELSLQE